MFKDLNPVLFRMEDCLKRPSEVGRKASRGQEIIVHHEILNNYALKNLTLTVYLEIFEFALD